MKMHLVPPVAAVAATLLVVSACSSDGGSSTSAGSTPEASFNTIAQPGAVADTLACGTGEEPTEVPGWPMGDSADPEIIPVIVSSAVAVGPNRLLYNVTDGDYRVITAPDVETSIAFYALERNPEQPRQVVDGVYLDTLLGRGLYRAAVDFDCAGEWGAEVTATLADGTTLSERMRFTVHSQDTTPMIGQPAPRSDSPTASTVEELQRISTDPNPFPGAFERTVGEVVTAGQPSLVFFATPAFCQTGYCGPTVNLVKSVAIDYEDRIGFVNVEPYELEMTDVGLQPRLDEDRQLVPVQAVIDYGIPVEPYLFIVDAEGDVFAKYEGVVGSDELRAAIEDVLAESS